MGGRLPGVSVVDTVVDGFRRKLMRDAPCDSNQHPNVQGHEKIAGLFEKWLRDWGLRPETEWATPS